MTPLEFLKLRGRDATEAMCIRAGTTLGYFEQIAYGYRRPSADLAKELEAQSNGDLSAAEMVFAPVKRAGDTGAPTASVSQNRPV